MYRQNSIAPSIGGLVLCQWTSFVAWSSKVDRSRVCQFFRPLEPRSSKTPQLRNAARIIHAAKQTWSLQAGPL